MNPVPGRNRDTDIEKGHVDTAQREKRGWDRLGDADGHIYSTRCETDR